MISFIWKLVIVFCFLSVIAMILTEIYMHFVHPLVLSMQISTYSIVFTIIFIQVWLILDNIILYSDLCWLMKIQNLKKGGEKLEGAYRAVNPLSLIRITVGALNQAKYLIIKETSNALHSPGLQACTSSSDEDVVLPLNHWHQTQVIQITELELCEKQRDIFKSYWLRENEDHMRCALQLDRVLGLNALLSRALYDERAILYCLELKQHEFLEQRSKLKYWKKVAYRNMSMYYTKRIKFFAECSRIYALPDPTEKQMERNRLFQQWKDNLKRDGKQWKSCSALHALCQ